MNGSWLRIVGVAGGFALVFATGFWLGHLGKPYSALLLAIHKLVATAIFVFLGVTTYEAFRMHLPGVVLWGTVALAFAGFIVMIASGGALSAMESPPSAVSLVHRTVPYVTLLFTAAAFYHLLWRSS